MRPAITFLAFLSLFWDAEGFNQEAAADQWSGAYVWLQTGRNLRHAGQDHLAWGSYLEALEQFEKLTRDYPDYEKEMVSYRLDALRKDIAEIEAGMTGEERKLGRAYHDFIQQIKQADEERYSGQRKEALLTMKDARDRLDRIIASDPAAVRPAVESQYGRLSDSIAWIDKQLSRVNTIPTGTIVRSSRKIYGTTEFVRESDLPASPGMASTSASLFPK